ncbi:hypothetical protein GCM10009624_09560 [Gordonia sinesedis]
MHIAMFTDFHPVTLGGIQHSVNDQRRELERRGHRVTVFAPPDPAALPDDGVVTLAGVFGVEVNGYAAVLPTPRNTRIVDDAFTARGPVDIVHVHTTYGVGAVGVKAAQRHRLPLVQTMHSRDDSFLEHTSPAPLAAAVAMRLLHCAFLSHCGTHVPVAVGRDGERESRAARTTWHTMIAHARHADAVIAPTRHHAELLVAHGLDTPVQVISNGVDNELLATLPDRAPRTDAEPLRVLWCGRLSAEKRPLAAIEAIAAAPDCVLDVAGDGDQAGAATDLVDRLGIGDRVRLLGRLDRADMLAAMRSHDVAVFTSTDFDTQGLVLLEAAAAGLPVVHCDPALTETIADGAGFLTADASPAAIAATLNHLAGDRDDLTAARDALRDTDVRQSTVTDAVVDLYAGLIADGGRRRHALPAMAGDVPVAPGRLPGVGHSITALRRGLRFIGGLGRIGPVVRLDLGPRRAYLLTTPDLIRQVGFGTAGRFHRDDLRAAMHEAIREASNVLTGERHELRRRQMAPALRRRRLAEYAVTTAAIADEWARSLPAGRRVDLKEQAHALVLETITSTLFTADFGAAALNRVRETVPWLLGQVIVRGALPPAVQRLRVRANRRFARQSADLREEIGAVVAQYRSDPTDYRDVLSVLVRHTDPDTGARLRDDEIIDELLLMVAAGVGSTASILAWVWHEVMTHPEVAARVRTEVADVVGDRPVTEAHLADLPYLHQVVSETLRMWGPWISSQTADGAVTFGDDDTGRVMLPDGAMIVYSPYLVLHDPRYYPDPETFDPDRWSADRAGEIDRRAQLAFGVGERHCPGSHFAMSTIVLATAALFARWIPEPTGASVSASTTDFVASPSRLPVTLRPAYRSPTR